MRCHHVIIAREETVGTNTLVDRTIYRKEELVRYSMTKLEGRQRIDFQMNVDRTYEE